MNPVPILLDYLTSAEIRRVEALGNHGGFSGAALWRVETPWGPLCLRCWPLEAALPQRLPYIHRLMEAGRAAGLLFVPAVYRTFTQQTWCAHAGRCWDLTQWQPGCADFHAAPSAARLRAACLGLAQLHCVWERGTEPPRPCPAVARRLAELQFWQTRFDEGWQPSFAPAAQQRLRTLAERAWAQWPQRLQLVAAQLAPWHTVAVRVQPCLCDVWHDNLLFTGDALTGLVDYGSVKLDHVAVDLARLLGSLVADDQEQWRRGLLAYQEVRALTPAEVELARVLDVTGTTLAIGSWLKWLCYDKRAGIDEARAALRLQALLARW